MRLPSHVRPVTFHFAGEDGPITVVLMTGFFKSNILLILVDLCLYVLCCMLFVPLSAPVRKKNTFVK